MEHFTDEQVATLPWEAVLAALRDAFGSKDRFAAADRVLLRGPQGASYLTMPCADREGWFGVKQVSVLAHNPARGLPAVHAWYTLFGPSGAPAAAGSASALTKLRTAGVSALAADALAPAEASRLLVVGAGALAPWMARAHLQVRGYASIRVWGRSPERARAVVADLERAGAVPAGSDLQVAPDLEAAVRAADVITVATTANEPLVRGAWLRPQAHLDLVGAFLPSMRETDADAVIRSQVIVDDVAAARQEAGDLHHASAEGWPWQALAGDLSAVLRGEVVPDRSRPTLFKSVGLALEDLAVARLLVR